VTHAAGPASAGAAPAPRAPAARRVLAEVVESARLPGEHHRLTLRAGEVAHTAAPGQFLHIWCHPPEEVQQPPSAAILRRPYSISRLRPPDGVEVLLRVRGIGGRLLARKEVGERLDVIGPLGRGFQIPEPPASVAIIAGGIGVAPVPFLVEALVARGLRVILLVGAREDGALPFTVARRPGRRAALPELEALGAEVSFVSEAADGVLVSDLLAARLGELERARAVLYAVGPRAMLKRLVAVTEGCLPLQVSLEERMACGVGACRSCVVPARGGGYRTVCREGPVFWAEEIDWERLDP